MSRDDMELHINNVLLACQLCLGLWQFSKLTPVGALIQGAVGALIPATVGWLLRPLRLSTTYSALQPCEGRVFKRANCFALQADIPSDKRDIVSSEVNTMTLHYLDSDFVLERKGEYRNMLFLFEKKGEDGNTKMCYYITQRIWKELQNLEQALRYGLEGPPLARAAVTRAHAERAEADAGRYEADLGRAKAVAEHAEAEARTADADAESAESRARRADAEAERAEAGAERAEAEAKRAQARVKREEAGANRAEARAKAVAKHVETTRAKAARARARATAARDPITDLTAKAGDARHKASAARAAANARLAKTTNTTLFVKGKKDFWKEAITGGVMTFEEVLDAIILYNQHVSVRLSNDWLLPVNLSVSEEKLLKIFNLVALFLQTKRANVHWLIPTSLSFIAALLEFNTSLRVWFYTKINKLFCSIMHLICDRLPRSWRREVYSLGKWVENLAPSNDMLVKVVRGEMCAIISEGAKVNKEGAVPVDWLETELDFTPDYGVIERQFKCHRIDIIIRCSYVVEHQLCEISAPPISVFYVKCKSIDDFRHIVTLVSCVADKCCGSLISYGLNNKKVCLRGFEESVISYVNNGLPRIYKLELENVVVAGKDAGH